MPDLFSEENIKAFVAAWYLTLDIHAPVGECLKLLADEGLEMVFPEKTMRTAAEFQDWYTAVTNFFFDENHNVASVDIDVSGDKATLGVVVAWQASWFVPPAAKSKRTSMDATQKWIVQKTKSPDKNAFGLEIVYYNATVVPFQYAPGFARL
jgi:hypothetical protein